ncbi:MAG: phospholipase C [Candidatus Azotimanducaceae bacterium]|jgi:phospholipase C
MQKSRFTSLQIIKWAIFIAMSIFALSGDLLASTAGDLTDSGSLTALATDPHKDSVNTKQITVLSYNIQQLGYPNWAGNHFEKQRLEMIPQTLLALEKRPDVLIFQEVFTPEAFDYLVNGLSEQYPHHTLVAGENCEDPSWASVSGDCQINTVKSNSGVLIFSQWPIEEQHAYVYHAVRISKSFDFMALKGVVYAKIRVGVEHPSHIHVFGTHLQATAKDHDVRMQQVGEMRKFIDGFGISAEQPVILGGDFNVSSTQQSRLDDLLAGANVALALEAKGVGSSSDATNSYRQLLSGFDAKPRPDKTLDYVLYRTDHLQPLNQPKLQVINLKSPAPWTGTRLFSPDVELSDLSDHYPVLMEFKFPYQSR